ncbi:Ig-like domain-containing protein [Desulfobacterota bacterium M19]
MNKRQVYTAWLTALICFLGIAVLPAGAHIIHVEWSYSGSAVSYNLYENGALVCTSQNPALMAMDCDVFLEETPMVFNLTAVDAAGVESPQSAPYILDPPPQDAYGNYIPQAEIKADVVSGTAPLAVSFDASASHDIDGTIDTWQWDFGDGDTGSGAIVNHTFTVAGTYVVTLKVIDNGSAAATATTSITVSPQGDKITSSASVPQAVITATPTKADSSNVAFDAYSSSDTNGTIVSYKWNFGDGDTATGDYAEHKYLNPGDYNVVLTVVDDSNASSQDSMTISVVDLPAANTPPVAIISAALEQHLVHFSWDYTPNQNLAGFHLYEDGIIICDITDPEARQADCPAYIDNGQVQFWVSAYDEAGVESDSQFFIFDSTGMFNEPITGKAPFSVHFSAGTSYDAEGGITAYNWDFGDGTVGRGLSIAHDFTSPGTYTVTLRVTDEAGAVTSTTRDITVNGTNNRPPVVHGAELTVDQDHSITATLSGSDPEGQPLTFKVVANGAKGTATITDPAAGVFTYVPKAGVYGTDAFIFKANDGINDSSAATVTVNIKQKVNHPPTAHDQSITLAEDGKFSGNLKASDPDGDSLTYTVTTNGTLGAVVVNKAGAFTYTPHKNAFGTDSFKFKVNDGRLDSTAATVTVNITPVNDAPAAQDDKAETEVNKAVSINVLANDTDVDGDTLTISKVGNGAHGTAVIRGGQILYTPKHDFTGTDSLTYTVTDGRLTNSATVNITVMPPRYLITVSWEYDSKVSVSGFRLYYNGAEVAATSDPAARKLTCKIPQSDGIKTFTLVAVDGAGRESLISNALTYDPAIWNHAPTARAASLHTPEDITLTGILSATDEDGDKLTYTLRSNGSHGTALITDKNTGAFTYTPRANFNGTDSFAFMVNDGKKDSAPATVSVTVVPVNDAPVAQADSLTIPEDTKASIDILANDTDVDGDPLTVTALGKPGTGKVVLSGNRAVYTPRANYNGKDSFTYTISDGNGGTAVGKVNIVLTPVNDAPVAVDDQAATEGINPVKINLLSNDTDVDGDTLRVISVTQPLSGQVTLNDGLAVYTAKKGFVGTDSFVYTISDSQGGTAKAGVTVVVTAPQQTISCSWKYSANVSNLAGFRLYRNGVMIGETMDKNARVLTCKAPVIEGPFIYTLTAVDTSGMETALSNTISYNASPVN